MPQSGHGHTAPPPPPRPGEASGIRYQSNPPGRRDPGWPRPSQGAQEPRRAGRFPGPSGQEEAPTPPPARAEQSRGQALPPPALIGARPAGQGPCPAELARGGPMDLRLRNAAFWASLPRRRGPVSGPTGERSPEEAETQPHLWRWVDPNRVCPIAGRPGPAACRREEALSSLGRGAQVPPAEETTCLAGTPRPLGRRRRGLVRWRGRRQKRAAGGWPPPPLHYSLLISLALSRGAHGSLAVRQIYQFVRHHFPFFRTAPGGWKNTVRHNLCFSSSFQKTAEFVCLEGNRKSRLWQLTPEGRHKLRAELQALSEAQNW
ncbi:forkhead box protein R1 isoform X4 [Sphaerodactylus townsendi]|uniref:forkhead box protein R1 isoform X4 n=1 Tax=Sphaerodactylus townsendi TaxID=933632 RepID=UPI002025E970|nr:forkhead box protein R1 isoform X4 [Sphaerodactylus townsendi]